MDRMILQDEASAIILSIIILYSFFLLWFRLCWVGFLCSLVVISEADVAVGRIYITAIEGVG